MADAPDLFTLLQRFARTLVTAYDLTDVLYELTGHVVELLGVTGAGVSLADPERGALRFATASDERFLAIEKVQEDEQSGPCFEAHQTNQVIRVADLGRSSTWPAYEAAARGLGVDAVLAVPMTYRASTIGALNVYSESVREWSDTEVERTRVLADLATSYVASSTELDAMRRVNGQLQEALDSRVLIEQAKGVLAGERDLTLSQAFEVLRAHARNHNLALRSVCRRVVEDGFRPD